MPLGVEEVERGNRRIERSARAVMGKAHGGTGQRRGTGQHATIDVVGPGAFALAAISA